MKSVLKFIFVIILLALVVVIIVIFIDSTKKIEADSEASEVQIYFPSADDQAPPAESEEPIQDQNAESSETTSVLNEPVEGFTERITLKPFGLWLDPNNSPVSPERFVGYHAGVDVEFTDRSDEIPVYAIASGIVVVARIAPGYGGVMVISHEIGELNILTVYGHLDPGQLLSVDELVEPGQQIGVLGEGYTSETDGERKHLHFGMLKIGRAELVGYANTIEELNQNWYNPMDFF